MAGMLKALRNRRLPGNDDEMPRDVQKDYRLIIGSWLREHRLEAGLTQEELSKIIGFRGAMISSVEIGDKAIPPERYQPWCDALGIDHKDFGLFILEHTDPWLYGMIFGEKAVMKHHLDAIPSRVTNNSTRDGKRQRVIKPREL